MGEFDLASTQGQGQPNSEVSCLHRSDLRLCSNNYAYKKQICSEFSELWAVIANMTRKNRRPLGCSTVKAALSSYAEIHLKKVFTNTAL